MFNGYIFGFIFYEKNVIVMDLQLLNEKMTSGMPRRHFLVPHNDVWIFIG